MENKTHYDILCISPKCTLNEIKIAYHQLIRKLHPDKCIELTSEQIQYAKRINKAYEILRNPQNRNEYDNSLKITKKTKTDFEEMKNDALAFLKTFEISQEEKENKRAEAEIIFKQKSLEMDKQIGLNREILGDVPTEEDVNKQFDQLSTLRDQEYIENLPQKIFNENDFDRNKFNEVFDAIAESSESLIKYTGETLPYNEIDASKIDEPDINIIPSTYLTDYSGRRIDSIAPRQKYVPPTKSLEELMKERNAEFERLKNMKMYEYKIDECIGASGTVDHATEWLDN